MKFWRAVAVQLLAIVLRDQHRESYPVQTPPLTSSLEVSCNCSEISPSASVSNPAIVISGFLGFVIGGVFATAVWALKTRRHEPTEPSRSRRRGGGVLSGPSSG